MLSSVLDLGGLAGPARHQSAHHAIRWRGLPLALALVAGCSDDPGISDSGSTPRSVTTAFGPAAVTPGAVTAPPSTPSAVGIASPAPVPSSSVCGDGLRSLGEGCDDGNVDVGDGCDGSCVVEPGYVCSAELGICIGCGNGRIESRLGPQGPMGVEGCDDGNRSAGDGCSQSCELELGFRCPTPGEPCVRACDDGGSCGVPAPGHLPDAASVNPTDCCAEPDAGCSNMCSPAEVSVEAGALHGDGGIEPDYVRDAGVASSEADAAASAIE